MTYSVCSESAMVPPKEGATFVSPLAALQVRHSLPKGVAGLPPIAGSVAAAPTRHSMFGSMTEKLPLRFWGKVRVLENGCWEWAGGRRRGYGQFYIGPAGKVSQAHRSAFEALVGQIPDGLTLDHRCHNNDINCPGGLNCHHRACVNTAHLEPLTHRENILRGRNHVARQAKQTRCVRGHAFSGANTYWKVRRDGRKYRTCRLCMAILKRRYRLRASPNSAIASPTGSQPSLIVAPPSRKTTLRAAPGNDKESRQRRLTA